ncbi:GL17469 [Drosophila persimilis]|uniref:GL17469 n=1 Tax=Drosophila persimilis TaxID=7234 RepID=B4GH63_DROPE|nr:GL17469 [Drosophila persimilis]
MEKKTEKKTSNLESNKTLKQAISISVDAIVKIKAKKRSAKEEAEKVAGEVGEARKRPLSQMSDAKSHRLPKMTGEKPAVPLAWSCSSGEGSVRLAPHSAKDEKKPAEQQAPPKKHRKRDSSKVNPRDPCKQAPKKQSQLFEVPIVPPNLETLPKYSRYAQEKFLLPVAIRGKKDLGINTIPVWNAPTHRKKFRGWPWKGDPAVIFRKVCVFHLHHQDVGVHKDLLEMAVHPLEISKNEPHTHGGILKEFWGTLDEYVRTQSQFSFLLEEGAYFALGCIPF